MDRYCPYQYYTTGHVSTRYTTGQILPQISIRQSTLINITCDQYLELNTMHHRIDILSDQYLAINTLPIYLWSISSDILPPIIIRRSTLCIIEQLRPSMSIIISTIVLSPGNIQWSTSYYLRETSRDQLCINELILLQLYIRQLIKGISEHLWIFWGYQHCTTGYS